MLLIGEIAAVGASLCFSINSVLVTLAGRQLGAVLANRASVVIACACIFVVNGVSGGPLLPLNAEPERWLLLGASGIFGYWFSFLLIIRAYLYIGPRLSLLVGSIAPVLSTVLAWLFLDEVLDTVSLLGIAVTIVGIVSVVAAKAENGMAGNRHDYRVGLLTMLAGALVRAVSQVLTKAGMAGDFPVITGSLMRVLVAMIAMFIFATLRGEVRSNLRQLRQHKLALREVTMAAMIGPATGATLLVLALQQAEVGVATTLGNMAPIFLIPIGYFVFHERITRRAVCGTIIAFFGTAILFWG